MADHDVASQFFVRSAGRVLGPFSRERLLEMRRLGRLPGFCEVSTNRTSWQPLNEVLPEERPVAQPIEGSRAQGAAPADVDLLPVSTDVPNSKIGMADTGAMLIMIGGWLWVAAVFGISIVMLISWVRLRPVDSVMAMFLPGVLAIGYHVLTIIGLAFCLTASVGKGVRPATITALAIVVLHLFFVLFAVGDSPGFDRKGDGPRGFGWLPVASALPFSSLLVPMAISPQPVTTELVFWCVTGFVEVARIIAICLVFRGLAVSRRNGNAESLSLWTQIVCGALVFVMNLVILLAVQELRNLDKIDTAAKVEMAFYKIITMTITLLYFAAIAIAFLYSLTATFTYLALTRAKSKRE